MILIGGLILVVDWWKVRFYTNKEAPTPNTQETVEALKILTSKPLPDDDEDEVVPVSEETARLGRSLAFKALGIATLLNLAAAALFVLVMYFVYGFQSIGEFKTSLNSVIANIKGNVSPTVVKIQSSASDVVRDIDVKGYVSGDTTPTQQIDLSQNKAVTERWELVKKTFKKRE
jgi:hypothetical protein